MYYSSSEYKLTTTFTSIKWDWRAIACQRTSQRALSFAFFRVIFHGRFPQSCRIFAILLLSAVRDGFKGTGGTRFRKNVDTLLKPQRRPVLIEYFASENNHKKTWTYEKKSPFDSPQIQTAWRVFMAGDKFLREKLTGNARFLF